MIGIEYFLFGYFCVLPKTEKNAVVYNMLLSRGIGMRRMKNGAVAIREKHRKTLASALSEMGAFVSETKGLPQYIYRNRKRYGAISALIVCLLLFGFVSCRVWAIRIQGVAQEDADSILSVLQEEGLVEGKRFRSLDFSKIENSLQASCPSVAWVNIHRRGTVIYVNVIGAQTGQTADEGLIGNLVAAEDAVVVEVSPDRGASSVKVGDSVRAGDMLVSAVHPDGTLSGASGVVLGRVSGKASASAGMKERKNVSQKIKNVGFTLNFFDFSINIFKNYRNLPNGYDIIESESKVRLFGRITLPISVTVRTAYSHKEETASYSEAEAIRLAGVRLRASLTALLSAGEMESMRTEGVWQNGEYVLTVHYVQIRNIARLEPIRLAGEK